MMPNTHFLSMSMKLSTKNVVKFLKDEDFHLLVKKLCKEKYIQNERTLQAYVWNHLRECFLTKRDNGKYLYYQDYFIDIENFEKNTEKYPDLVIKKWDTQMAYYVIELKHYASSHNVTKNMFDDMKKDIEKLNNNNCEGAFLFTCTSKSSYEDTLIQLNNLNDTDTTIIPIQCGE